MDHRNSSLSLYYFRRCCSLSLLHGFSLRRTAYGGYALFCSLLQSVVYMEVYFIGKLPDIISWLSIGELRKGPVATLNSLLRSAISEYEFALLVDSKIPLPYSILDSIRAS